MHLDSHQHRFRLQWARQIDHRRRRGSKTDHLHLQRSQVDRQICDMGTRQHCRRWNRCVQASAELWSWRCHQVCQIWHCRSLNKVNEDHTQCCETCTESIATCWVLRGREPAATCRAIHRSSLCWHWWWDRSWRLFVSLQHSEHSSRRWSWDGQTDSICSQLRARE